MRLFASSVLLAITLMSTSPGVIRADDQDKHTGERNREKDRRYYDANRRDWHDWNEQEDRAYRQYLEEHRHEYRDFGKLNKKEQREYWDWRHSHRDSDDRR